ncbi:MAG: type II secretion system protein [Clostridiales bacterium]|nr:type II secretion system protein [Clostridiales bacterium]
MLKRIRKTNHKCRQAFTLTELIVVLVILAVLAAMLVPALTGYIDRAKQKKDINEAQACLVAAQAALTEAYAKGSKTDIKANRNVAGIDKSKVNDYGDANCVNSDFAKNVLNYVDKEPYIFLVATGNCNNSDIVSEHDMYIVYYACYVPEKDARPYYYYNGAWTTENGANVNAIVKNEKAKSNTLNNLPIQYYIIANKDKRSLQGLSDSSFWGYLRNVLPKKYGDTSKD